MKLLNWFINKEYIRKVRYDLLQKNIKDSKIYTKEIFWFIGKHFVIFEIICIPIIIYYFLVGFLADKTVLPRGYFVLALFVFMLVVLIFTVVFCKRVISTF